MPVSIAKVFEVEIAGDTVILIPQADLSKFAFQKLDAEASEILEMLDETAYTSVIIDCHKTSFFGSIALGVFVKLWQRVQKRKGRMALCHVSDYEKEILCLTKTDSLWAICSSRSEALEAFRDAEAS